MHLCLFYQSLHLDPSILLDINHSHFQLLLKDHSNKNSYGINLTECLTACLFVLKVRDQIHIKDEGEKATSGPYYPLNKQFQAINI